MKFGEFAAHKHSSLDEHYMSLAINEAEKAKLDGNLAVGAVLAWGGRVLSDSNTVYSEGDCTNHAEMNVIHKAQTINRHLHDAVLYVTLEPCLMCATAARLHGIREVVFGCYDEANGFISSKLLVDHTVLEIACRGGILGEKCMDLLPTEMHGTLRFD